MGKYTKIKADGGPIKKVRISDKGVVKDVPINTKEYKQYYDSKTLAKASEDPNLLIAAQDLNPVEVKAEKPTWLTFKEEAIKNYPESKFRSEYFLPALRPSDLDSLPQSAQDEYNKRINDLIAEKLLKSNPSFDEDYDKDRLKALSKFSPYELNIIKNSNLASKVEPSIWQKFEQGLLSLNAGPVQYKNENLTPEEAKDENTPLNILTPLSIPGKVVQSLYRPGYTVNDALRGKANNAGIVEDLYTDPLNYIGLGLMEGAGKLPGLNKVLNTVNKVGDVLTTQTPLKNAYKVNPTAFNPKIAPQQMGINLKGAFQKYPKDKLTQLQLDAITINNPYYKNIPEYYDRIAAENGKEARRIYNNLYHGGSNWEAPEYITAGILGMAAPAMLGLYGYALAPGTIRNKLDRPESLVDRDTTIDLTNTPMDYAKVNETKDGKVIIGGEFIENANNTVRTAKDWLTATDTYSDKKYPSKDIQSFYGVENGKFKVGKANEFSPNTEIVPRRFGESNINKAVLNGDEMRILDKEGKPIYQNTPNKGKFILYSPSSKKAEFIFINSGKTGVNKVNEFIKKNKDAQYIHLDNGRYEYYGLNKRGLNKHDFRNYYEQDWEREGNPGYNLVVKQYGGYINNDMNTNYAMGGMIKRKDGSYSKRGLWDNIRANKGSGKKPTKEMLEQERKIKAKYADGGPLKYDMYGTPIESNIQPSNVERSYYDPRTDTIYLGTDYNQMDDNQKNNLLAHENYHSMQFKGDKSTFLPTDTGIKKPAMMSTDDVYYSYHNRQPIEAQQGIDDFRQANPSFNLVPDDLIYNNVVDYSQYLDPNTMEGGAQFYGDTGWPVDEDFYGKGGYIVTRSKDRKGKTHKVTGPDGTVKYFGDSKLGQHPNDPARKKAFYARHAKNLKNNPHFRAFARKTWADGGYIDNPPNDMPLNLPLKEQNPYLVPEYNQPMANGYILPDINRPRLLPEVNASEYKASYDTGTPDEIQIPTIVGGQYIGNNALERYKNTGEKFKTMKDPTSYSKYYDEYGKLHPKAMAIGGNMNQAQRLNAGKVSRGSSGGNSFGDYAADFGNYLLDGVTGIAEGLTGAEIYNPTYNTKLGKIAGAVNNQSGKMMGKIAPMALNMVAPGVGTAVGMAGKAVGTGLNASKNEEANGQLNLGNSMLPNMLGNNMEGIAQMETMGAAEAMQFKQGGLMHINEGGTHEQNAMGGVPIGPNALVEEGETINNDFVFSDRLTPMGSKKTYAQLSKRIDSKYKLRPHDPLSKEAKQMELDNLALQQESQKEMMSYGGVMAYGGKAFTGPVTQTVLNYNQEPSSMSNFMEPESVYENPVNSQILAKGGKIYIKPENRGKFNATKARTGKTTEELTHSKNPLTRKRAIFAQNAKKWKHAMGGYMYDDGGPMLAPINSINSQYSSDVHPIGPFLQNNQFSSFDFSGPDMDQTVYSDEDFPNIDYTGINQYNALDNLNPPPIGSSKFKKKLRNFNSLDSDQDYLNSPALDIIGENNTPLNIQSIPYYNPQVQGRNVSSPMNVVNNPEANFMEQMQGNAFDKSTASAQNPYGKVGNVGYLSNLAGNLIKAGMVATSKPPIYNPSLRLNRLNSTPAERLAALEGRREIQGAKDLIRRNATSSGQYLTNASLLGASSADQMARNIANIRQGYDTQNVGIGNQEAQLNQQITAANNLAREQFRDNRLNQYNKILDSVIGANQQRFATDVHANNFQNQVISLLKTGVYHIGKTDADGMYEILGPNNEVISKVPAKMLNK